MLGAVQLPQIVLHALEMGTRGTPDEHPESSHYLRLSSDVSLSREDLANCAKRSDTTSPRYLNLQ